MRLVSTGITPRREPWFAVLLMALLLLPALQPVQAQATVSRDDFGILGLLEETLADVASNEEDEVATDLATSVMASVRDSIRATDGTDPIAGTTALDADLSLRSADPLDPQHPRPYEFLVDQETQPSELPDNILDTLFGLPPNITQDPFAFGINQYILYTNYTSDVGIDYETWTDGSFTGDLLSFDGDAEAFSNRVDIDGDGSFDLRAGLTILGLGDRGDGWDIETGQNGLVVESIWIRPNLQWRIEILDPDAPMWSAMTSLEVTLLKGFAYDLTGDGESYALVIDTAFTEPPHDFQLRVGIERIEFSVTAVTSSVVGFLASLVGGDIGASDLSLTSITAPYSISINNPDADASADQTTCDAGYDPNAHGMSDSRSHPCGFHIGLGYIHFEPEVEATNTRQVMEFAYVDVGLHPVMGSDRLPSEVDLVLRNDNLGENGLDTIELFSDRPADLWFHYFEDRTGILDSDLRAGNISDARLWIRDLPSSSLPPEEIAAVFTMLGNAPTAVEFPGRVPQRLSLIIALKNFTRDISPNVEDATLPIDPSDPPTSLILISGTQPITEVHLVNSMMRHGSSNDVTSMEMRLNDLPPTLAIHGTFELPGGGASFQAIQNADLDLFSTFLDNTLINIVEIILDIGSVINGLPNAIIGTAGEAGGTVVVEAYTQVRSSLPDGRIRLGAEVGELRLSLSSFDHPTILNSQGHLLLASDTEVQSVQGRYGPEVPMVPVAIDAHLRSIARVEHTFDPPSGIRNVALDTNTSTPLSILHVTQTSGDLANASTQVAEISNLPERLRVLQTPERVTYEANEPIGTIAYAATDGHQRNAVRLTGLPSRFEFGIGGTIGYHSQTPLEFIEVQTTNATAPRTMDGDHFGFWVDGDRSEATMSMRISGISDFEVRSPVEPGANGPDGLATVQLIRNRSAPFGIVLDDRTQHEDPFLGLDATGRIDPLPADISFQTPSSVDGTGLTLPDFGDEEGVLGLSLFLDDLVRFGATVNDVIHDFTVDLVGTDGPIQNASFGVDLVTGEPFDLTFEATKGRLVTEEPSWMQGIGAEVVERTTVGFNLSRTEGLTASTSAVILGALQDGEVQATERLGLIEAFSLIGLNTSDRLVTALEDGAISDDEARRLPMDAYDDAGLVLTDRRAWSVRTWLPSLPSGRIDLDLTVTVEDQVPTFQFDIGLYDWTPAQPTFQIEMNGFGGRDLLMILDGFTNVSRDVVVNATVSSDTEGAIPRATVDLQYDLGQRLETALVRLIDHHAQNRVDVLLEGVPEQMNLISTVGDILRIDLNVPPEHRVSGGNSAERAMIRTMQFMEGAWWPATVYMNDLPGELYLTAEPDYDFDIRRNSPFQGLTSLDYRSSGVDMDLYVNAHGRAINTRGNTLMIAENLPQTFAIRPTETYGLEVVSSGDGVEHLFLQTTDLPATPGVELRRLQVVGEDLKGATVHMETVMEYPIVFLDDITTGRLIATAEADVTYAGISVEGRAVLLDAQFTGVIPTSSTLSVNGLASDLTLLNSLTGGGASTRHIIVAEPFTSSIATFLTTFIW